MAVTGKEPGRNRRHRAMSLAPSSVLAAAFVAAAHAFAPQPAAARVSVAPSEVGLRKRTEGCRSVRNSRATGQPG